MSNTCKAIHQVSFLLIAFFTIILSSSFAFASKNTYDFNVTHLGTLLEEQEALKNTSYTSVRNAHSAQNEDKINKDKIAEKSNEEFHSRASQNRIHKENTTKKEAFSALDEQYMLASNESDDIAQDSSHETYETGGETGGKTGDETAVQESIANTQENVTTVDELKPPHILVVAGIQGDEPGGFSAASLLATRYSISYGSVTIVPNLNFLAIINRKRGVYGDMNRKFAALDENDPEYEIVQRIKEMIVSPSIDLVLNLHDGSGFYNPKYISDLQNPNRWGNSIIIDQDDFDAPRFGELRAIGTEVAEGVNTNLLKDLHAIHVHNTKTAEGNEEMAKSLTWFALGKGKPAFGVEASKNLNVAERTFYHLSMLENFFDYVGIKYHRPFELSPAGIQKALSTDIFIGFEQNRLVLPLNNIRRNQAGSIPLSKESRCLSNSPIITAVTKNNEITVHYGNNYLTSFKIDWHDVDTTHDRMNVIIDGTPAEVPFGTIVYAQDYFLVEPKDGLRVNAIGAVVGNGPRGDESGKKIRRKDFQGRFSIDKSATTYRVEVYSGKKYVGTFVVQYVKNSGEAISDPLGQ